MADEDIQNAPDQENQAPDPIGQLRSETDAKLAEITAQLKAQNEVFARNFQALMPKAPPEPTIGDDDVLDPRGLRDKIVSEANRTITEALNEERRKNATIVNLAKEYPEINTDSKFQDAIVEAQKSLPQSIRDTADGYELAIMKAVARQGILPKSKRTESDPDGFTAASSSSSAASARQRAANPKGKVSDKTLAMAQLLGRDISDPEVVKSLQNAAKRGYGRFS